MKGIVGTSDIQEAMQVHIGFIRAEHESVYSPLKFFLQTLAQQRAAGAPVAYLYAAPFVFLSISIKSFSHRGAVHTAPDRKISAPCNS